MALRYKVPAGLDIPRPDGELKRVQLRRQPQVVEFRRGADLSIVASEVVQHQSVVLDAAVGAGKSSLAPAALAKQIKGLVYYVVPNPMLAYAMYRYALKRQVDSASVEVAWSGNESEEPPRVGVYYTSSADFVAKLAAGSRPVDLAGALVFLDEAHESDACTHLVRTLALDWGACTLVQASATMHVKGMRPRETPGTVEMKTFPRERTPDTWQADERDAPWSCSLLNNGLVVFVDSRRDAAYLKTMYEDAGMLVYRLTSESTVQEYDVGYSALSDKKGALVVLLLDYSFRSGFSFEADRVIDTGSVSYVDPAVGQMRRLSREIFENEAVQSAGRIGRISAGKYAYYRPASELQRMVCDLDGVEREAAAYLSRVMGFKPLGPLSGTYMATRDLPARVSVRTALNGQYPLTYYVVDSTGRSRSPSADASSASRSETPPAPDYVHDSDYSSFAALFDTADSSDERELGPYCSVAGVDPATKRTMVFADGLASVRSFLARPAAQHLVHALPVQDREYALAQVMNRRNVVGVESDAIHITIQEWSKATTVASVNLREMFKRLFEELGVLKAEQAELGSALRVLAAKKYKLLTLQPFNKSVAARVQAYRDLLQDVMPVEYDYESALDSHEHSVGSLRSHLTSSDYGHSEAMRARSKRLSSGRSSTSSESSVREGGLIYEISKTREDGSVREVKLRRATRWLMPGRLQRFEREIDKGGRVSSWREVVEDEHG